MPAKRILSRRKMLHVLAAIGVTGPAAAESAAQSRTRTTSPAVSTIADAIVDQPLADDRLRTAEAALVVRDLEIDDLIEPAPIFHARGL
jgi:hypothetical protein